MRGMAGAVQNNKLQRAIDSGAQFFQDFDLDFYRRVWTTDLNLYRRRLKAIEFVGMENVLDAGSGMGQWTLCLSESNKHVQSIDVCPARVRASQAIMNELGVRNVEISQGCIEETGYADNIFDGVFCYGVLLFTDHRKVCQEFYRILKPGGKLYICTNGLGWYIYNLLSPHHPSRNFDPRQMAIDALSNTVAFFAEKKECFEGQISVPSAILRKYLESIGFERVMVTGEGKIKFDDRIDVPSFFKAEYCGLEGVYELLAWKKCQPS
jgi:ubiquinone/menaquinone biosynthesis C-methylase UbiE